MARIVSPVEGYSGDGPAGVEFEDGVAETDNEGAIAYFRSAGYTVDDEAPAEPEPTPQVDAREAATEVKVGAPLRDAAVDPQPEDFLAPVNAGNEDPHGPRVVAPGVHAMPPGPIVPGDVHVDDVRVQEDIETKVAAATLVEGHDVGEVTQAAAQVNGAADTEVAEDQGDDEPQRPARSANKAEWIAYATSVDDTLTADAAEALKRDELVERYGKD